jgi:iron complex outermembrane receptor protein
LTDNLDTYDLDFQDRFRLGERNRFVWGLGYRFTHDVVANAPALSFSPSILDQSLYSCFLQDEVMLHPKLHLTIGSKLEHNDYTGFEVEPSAACNGISFPNKCFGPQFRAQFGRHPELTGTSLNRHRLPLLVLLEGSSDFVSETLIAYELGYRAQLGPKVFTSVSTFYNVYNDIRSTSTNAPDAFGLPLPLFFQNNLEGQTYGMEFSTTYQVLDWWRLHGGYDLLKEDIHVKPGEYDFNDALNETVRSPAAISSAFFHGFAAQRGPRCRPALGGHTAQQ